MRPAMLYVKRGARLLDQAMPDWWNGRRRHKLNLDKLDLSSCQVCVLGQLYGTDGHDGFHRGLKILTDLANKGELRLPRNHVYIDPDEDEIDATYFGFDMSGKVTYDELDRAWRTEVETRRRMAEK